MTFRSLLKRESDEVGDFFEERRKDKCTTASWLWGRFTRRGYVVLRVGEVIVSQNTFALLIGRISGLLPVLWILFRLL